MSRYAQIVTRGEEGWHFLREGVQTGEYARPDGDCYFFEDDDPLLRGILDPIPEPSRFDPEPSRTERRPFYLLHPNPKLRAENGARWIRADEFNRPDWESFPVYRVGDSDMIARRLREDGNGLYLWLLKRNRDSFLAAAVPTKHGAAPNPAARQSTWRITYSSAGTDELKDLPEDLHTLGTNEYRQVGDVEFWRVKPTVQDLIDSTPAFRRFLQKFREYEADPEILEVAVILF